MAGLVSHLTNAIKWWIRVSGVNPKKFNNMQTSLLSNMYWQTMSRCSFCANFLFNYYSKNFFLRLFQYLSQKKIVDVMYHACICFWNCGKSSMSYVNEGGREFQSLEYINILWYFAAQSLLPTIQIFFSKKALNIFTYI